MNPADHMRPREINRVIRAVNSRETPQEAGLQTESELALYASIRAEAEHWFDKHGIWPVFELCELD